MASDYLPGVYTRIGTEENPGTFRGGSGSGISNSMPPITVKPWVLKNDKWNMRGYWISGGIFNIPPVWLMDNGIWNKKNEYLGFECQKDLGVQKADLTGIYQVYVLDKNGAVTQEIVFECK